MQSRIVVPHPIEFHPSPNEEDSLRGDLCLILLILIRRFPKIPGWGRYAR